MLSSKLLIKPAGFKSLSTKIFAIIRIVMETTLRNDEYNLRDLPSSLV